MKKFLSILLIIILMIFTMTVSVSGLSFTATMTPSATTVSEATEFTITVKVSNLDVGTNGINSLSGYLKYDTDVFDTISESSIEGLNSWNAKYDATTGKIELTKNTFVTSTQEVFQITFKTKTGVTGKSGTISYSNIVASNSETNISATDISTAISVGTGTGTENPTNSVSNISVITANTVGASNTTNNAVNISANTNIANNATNNVASNVANNTTNNAVSSYVNTMTNTTSESDMPKTGVNDTILMMIFGAIAVAIVFYIKIEKLNKDLK